jgi:hypothetical protein
MATHAQSDLFLADVRRNLRVMRYLHGPQSRQYRRLVRLYRDVADAHGCRSALERILHRLRRRAPLPCIPPSAARERGSWAHAHTARQRPPVAISRERVARPSSSGDSVGPITSPAGKTSRTS